MTGVEATTIAVATALVARKSPSEEIEPQLGLFRLILAVGAIRESGPGSVRPDDCHNYHFLPVAELLSRLEIVSLTSLDVGGGQKQTFCLINRSQGSILILLCHAILASKRAPVATRATSLKWYGRLGSCGALGCTGDSSASACTPASKTSSAGAPTTGSATPAGRTTSAASATRST